MADDVEAVRVALNLGKIDLLGHSCGGVLAEAYALKYQQHLNHLILNSTFASTREMNEVLAREKAQMPPDKLARLNELEQAGLFDKGAPWEHGRYPAEYADARLGLGLLSTSSTARAPTPTTIPRKATPPPTGSFTAKCGAPTASSSSTAISNRSSRLTACPPSTSPRWSSSATTTSATPASAARCTRKSPAPS